MTTLYANEADLAEVMGAQQIALLDTDVIQAALASASSMADGYIAATGAAPLTAWPKALRQAVAKIAAWELVSGPIGFNPDGTHEIFLEKYKQAVKWLGDVSAGRVTLIAADTSPTRGSAPSVVSGTSQGF